MMKPRKIVSKFTEYRFMGEVNNLLLLPTDAKIGMVFYVKANGGSLWTKVGTGWLCEKTSRRFVRITDWCSSADRLPSDGDLEMAVLTTDTQRVYEWEPDLKVWSIVPEESMRSGSMHVDQTTLQMATVMLDGTNEQRLEALTYLKGLANFGVV